jgi:hypothetical protein
MGKPVFLAAADTDALMLPRRTARRNAPTCGALGGFCGRESTDIVGQGCLAERRKKAGKVVLYANVSTIGLGCSWDALRSGR